MKRTLDLLRACLVSPELLGLAAPIAVSLHYPESAAFVAQLIDSDFKWGIGAALVPLGFMGAGYRLGTDVLFPQGARRVLLDWPDYWMLKSRVVIALSYCGVAFLISATGFYWIARGKSSIGATLMFSAWLSAAVSLMSVALARWKVREIVGG